MADIRPKNIEIKKNIPTGSTTTSDSGLNMPPPQSPPGLAEASSFPSGSTQKPHPEMELPPLPADLMPSHKEPKSMPEPHPQSLSLTPNSAPYPNNSSSPTSQKNQDQMHSGPPMNPAAHPAASTISQEPDMETVEVSRTPASSPLQKELKRKISHVKGPVFISLERYKEVKELLLTLKENSHDLRDMVDQFKDNKKEGTDLLSNSVDKLENIEESIENINSTLRT